MTHTHAAAGVSIPVLVPAFPTTSSKAGTPGTAIDPRGGPDAAHTLSKKVRSIMGTWAKPGQAGAVQKYAPHSCDPALGPVLRCQSGAWALLQSHRLQLAGERLQHFMSFTHSFR